MRTLGTILLLTLLAADAPAAPAGGIGTTSDLVPRELEGIAYEPPLGETIPMDVELIDSRGRESKLGELLEGRPTLLVLAYYECPMLCTLVLDGLVRGLRGLDLKPGEDYEVIAVSFDPSEGPELAAAKRATHVARHARPGAEDAWRFLTGRSEQIERLTDAVGFRYVEDPATGEFSHASGVLVLSPDGTMSRALFGVDFPPRQLELAIVDASQGEVGSLIDRLVLYCHRYDPTTGRYGTAVMSILRIAGGATVVALLAFMLLARRRSTVESPPESPGDGPRPLPREA